MDGVEGVLLELLDDSGALLELGAEELIDPDVFAPPSLDSQPARIDATSVADRAAIATNFLTFMGFSS